MMQIINSNNNLEALYMWDNAKQLLDSCEISSLWESYMAESLTICVLKNFLNNVDDNDTHFILKYTFDLSNQYLKDLISLFNQSALPIPEGFTDKDVNINAPRLFTDEFYLFYLSDKARSGMFKYTQSLSYSSRSDIRAYFTKRINESSDLSEDENGKVTYNCNNSEDKPLTTKILNTMPEIDVSSSLKYFEDHGGYCDFDIALMQIA